jgi:CBS domain-containing protein
MKVSNILQSKGQAIHDIGPDASLSDVVASLVALNCGSLLVRENNRVLGIITERDILRSCAVEDRSLDQISVREKMSTDLVIGRSEDTVSSVMGLLTKNRIRHLPVIDDGQLAGIISIGDVVKAQHDELATENHFLKNYIQS